MMALCTQGAFICLLKFHFPAGLKGSFFSTPDKFSFQTGSCTPFV
jgi:hypothetical protein